ncbi:MAG: chemotaxis protein CheB [Actinomycetes bacterium]
MKTRDLVVVGASAGGVEALSRFVAGLPEDLPATVLVVMHLSPRGPSALPAILARSGNLPVRTATPREPLRHGVVLVGPPDHHMTVTEDGTVSLVAGPHENGYRPAVDVLFRTAARALGPRVIAVVLSGNLDDGTAGAAAVRAQGGLVFVQAAEDALHPAMPTSARDRAGADLVADANRLADAVVQRCAEVVDESLAVPAEITLRQEADVAHGDPESFDEDRVGGPSGLTCPDCQGSLYTVEDGPLLRFRCRVGHAWSMDSLAQQHEQSVETALWTALRTLEEKADFCARLASRAISEERPHTAQRLHHSIETARRSADKIKELLAELDPSRPEPHHDEGTVAAGE